MVFKVIHIATTDSTNRYCREIAPEYPKENLVVTTNYQTAGRGCDTNTWESERGKNLLFSVLVHPTWVPVQQQFLLSMCIAVAIRRMLVSYLTQPVEIKWPNDIYVCGKKICGILIENRLQAGTLHDCIMGIGLNVKQTGFPDNVPNATSMLLVAGVDRFVLMHVRGHILKELGNLLEHWDAEALQQEYAAHLYRRDGFHVYRDRDGLFEAELLGVKTDGHLLLRDRTGRERCYAFKEVSYILSE